MAATNMASLVVAVNQQMSRGGYPYSTHAIGVADRLTWSETAWSSRENATYITYIQIDTDLDI